MAEAVDAHWPQTKKVAIDEPQIVLGPDTVGLIVAMSSLDEITSRSVRPIHSTDERPTSSGSSRLFCLLFKPYSVLNLTAVIRMYGNSAMTASCFKNQRILIAFKLNDETLEDFHASAFEILCMAYSAPNLKDLMIRLLDDSGIDPANASVGRANALFTLCRYYHGDHIIEIFDLLIERGIDLNATIVNGWNALHTLCTLYRGRKLMPLVEYFINRGIDPTAKTEKTKLTVLDLVCRFYRGDDLRQLIELLLINSKDHLTGPRALLVLCKTYCGDDLKDLIQLFIDHIQQRANVTDINGWNALHHLFVNYPGRQLKHSVQLFLANGIDVKAITKEGFSVLHLACQNYSGADLKEVIEILVENGVEMSRTVEGEDALYFILRNNYNRPDLPDIVNLFYDKKGVQQYKNDALFTACFFYRGPGLLDIVKRTVEGAPVLDQYDPSKMIEDMKLASNALTLYNQDLWDDDRKKVKNYLDDATDKFSKFNDTP